MVFSKQEQKLGKHFPAGDTIARNGDIATHLYVIQSGVVEVYRTGFDGNRVHLAFLKAGDMFGIMALFDKKPFYSTIQALEDTWVLLIDKRTILRRIYEDPSLVLRIIEHLADRIRRQSDELVELTNEHNAAMGGLVAIAKIMQSQEQGIAINSVAYLVERTCRKLCLLQGCTTEINEDFIENIKLASYFYDIGNAGLPAGLLAKQGGLQPEEKDILKTHIHIGSNVLTKIAETTPESGYFRLAAELAKYHHERFDGTGYIGLVGAQIPLVVRIISVVDVYSALLVERPYRGAMTPSQALAHITEKAGTHFDPQVVAAFCEVVSQNILTVQHSLK